MCARTLASSFRPSSSSSGWRRMKSQHERTRKESHGGWRSGEQREKQDLHSLYLYATHSSTLQGKKRERKKKKTSISLSLFEYTTYTAMYYVQLHIEEKNTSLWLFSFLVFSFSRLLAYGHISYIASSFFLLLLWCFFLFISFYFLPFCCIFLQILAASCQLLSIFWWSHRVSSFSLIPVSLFFLFLLGPDLLINRIECASPRIDGSYLVSLTPSKTGGEKKF